MKILFTFLFSTIAFFVFSQNITNQIGGNTETSKFIIDDSDGNDLFTVRGDKHILSQSSLSMPIRLISADANLTYGDYTILCDATNGNITIQAPNVTHGTILNLRRIDAEHSNTVTIVDGSGNSHVLSKPGEGALVQYFVDTVGNATGWWQIAGIN